MKFKTLFGTAALTLTVSFANASDNAYETLMKERHASVKTVVTGGWTDIRVQRSIDTLKAVKESADIDELSSKLYTPAQKEALAKIDGAALLQNMLDIEMILRHKFS